MKQVGKSYTTKSRPIKADCISRVKKKTQENEKKMAKEKEMKQNNFYFMTNNGQEQRHIWIINLYRLFVFLLFSFSS